MVLYSFVIGEVALGRAFFVLTVFVVSHSYASVPNAGGLVMWCPPFWWWNGSAAGFWY